MHTRVEVLVYIGADLSTYESALREVTEALVDARMMCESCGDLHGGFDSFTIGGEFTGLKVGYDPTTDPRNIGESGEPRHPSKYVYNSAYVAARRDEGETLPPDWVDEPVDCTGIYVCYGNVYRRFAETPPDAYGYWVTLDCYTLLPGEDAEC